MRTVVLGVACGAVLLGACGQRELDPGPSALTEGEIDVGGDVTRVGAAGFLVGAWRGEAPGGGVIEEHWMAPEGGRMVGMFRWDKGSGGLLVQELLNVWEDGGRVMYDLRHFGGAMEAWEDGGPPVRFAMVEARPGRVRFERADGGAGVQVVEYVLDGRDLVARLYEGDAPPMVLRMGRVRR